LYCRAPPDELKEQIAQWKKEGLSDREITAKGLKTLLGRLCQSRQRLLDTPRV
jgi:hypothetical protein